MVKAPALLLSTSTTQKNSNHHYRQNEQQNQYTIQYTYKEFYQQYTAPQEVYFNFQPIEMANDTSSSTSSCIAPVSVLAIPAIATVTSTTGPPVPATSRQSTTTVSNSAVRQQNAKDCKGFGVTKSSKHSSQQQQQPSIHVAPPPRLALHHLHPLGPIAIQANPNPWPIVEPVFHFGPGFEHQHYCPTHSQGPQPHEYVVFFHVNAGVSVTFQISGNREVIRGK